MADDERTTEQKIASGVPSGRRLRCSARCSASSPCSWQWWSRWRRWPTSSPSGRHGCDRLMAHVDLTEHAAGRSSIDVPQEGPVKVVLVPRTILVWVAVTAAAILALMFVYLALDAISWVLVAAFFAMALNPVVEALVRRGLGRARAAAITFVVAFAALGLLGFLVVPPLVTRDDGVRRGAAALPPRARRGQGPAGGPRAELPPRRTARRRLRARWDRRPARPREAGRLDRARCGRRRAWRSSPSRSSRSSCCSTASAGCRRRSMSFRRVPARAGSACSRGSTARSAAT